MVSGFAAVLDSTARQSGSTAVAFDPAEIAAEVRQIALEAHRVLKNPYVASDDLRAVLRRLRVLRRQTRCSALIEIDHWLENADALVKTRARTLRQATERLGALHAVDW